jgi:hypothetical protein
MATTMVAAARKRDPVAAGASLRLPAESGRARAAAAAGFASSGAVTGTMEGRGGE